jgi:GNAT superfamily N-acetyltransferase
VEFAEITEQTQDAFFRCLPGPATEPLDLASPRRQWYVAYRERGYRARVLQLDSGEIVGKCHTIPIAHSPLVGHDLVVILCLYVHMYARHIGDQRGKGYGQTMLRRVEQDALDRGFKGVAAWAMDWDWNPVSFYDRMGYTRIDREDKVVVVWKPLRADAEPPRLMRLPERTIPAGDKVDVYVADNAWCDNCNKLRVVRQAVSGLEDVVTYREAGPPYRDRIIHLGHVGGVYLDGKAYRPYRLIGDSADLRAEIVRLHRLKTGAA